MDGLPNYPGEKHMVPDGGNYELGLNEELQPDTERRVAEEQSDEFLR